MNTVTQTDNSAYLTEQLITYIGNKRALLSFIEQGISHVSKKMNREKLVTFDVFSGSGIVSRFLKQSSSHIYANDMEQYASVISQCYLDTPSQRKITQLKKLHSTLTQKCSKMMEEYLLCGTSFRDTKNLPGFISELYAPKDIKDIKKGERCFYTPYNACYIDCMRQCIDTIVPQTDRHFFIAPLLSESSIHANTGGVFKGFYKNSSTGIGKFGGNGENAMSRITGHISLPFPVFSSFKTEFTVFCENANDLASSKNNPHVDLAYIDPPYNQHPYGSNYFMLNLIAKYERPSKDILSRVSGIPSDWNRSMYNKKSYAEEAFVDLVTKLDAKFLLISFNNEGFIQPELMKKILSDEGKVTVLESPYTAYRASRNLSSRTPHVKEFLYIVEKR